MLFNEKLQNLRKNKGVTQEELAKSLFVSRTAVSKWESGRGYPNIDSLKAIAKYFGVSVDELLSCEEALAVANESQKQNQKTFRAIIFGLADAFCSLLLFLPLFANRNGQGVAPCSVVGLTQIQPYLKVSFLTLIILTSAYGIFALTLQNYDNAVWEKCKFKISFGLSLALLLLFILTLQPYASIFVFLSLAIKTATLVKWQRH